jgi:hypothetical protein
MLHELRLVYFTPDQAKQAGFLETEHFGVLFPHRMSHIDLTGIPQHWLRDLTWDYIADLLRSPGCPRTASPVDGFRRAAAELGVFLELEAPGGGHDPAALRREHMDQFVADQRHREREALPSLAVKRPGGGSSTVTITTRSMVFNAARKLLRDALERGAAERLGLDRQFIIAIPAAGATMGRTARRPFPDEVARALADEANLAALAATYDVNDGGVRDIWETTVITGRRIGEVIKLRWDCIGRYSGLAKPDPGPAGPVATHPATGPSRACCRSPEICLLATGPSTAARYGRLHHRTSLARGGARAQPIWAASAVGGHHLCWAPSWAIWSHAGWLAILALPVAGRGFSQGGGQAPRGRPISQ